ncbi:MAG TPA: DUF885 domain-containing protein [Gammaproteobacteria bacterium]|nr:DUF885 domain-containing protein [Gammaproteobacteria bacterium]
MPIRIRASLLAVAFIAAACTGSPAQGIDDFFREFTDDWVRRDPNLAVRARYFDGEEQDRLSRELTPATREHRLETIARAEEGLGRLVAFDREALTPAQRVSASVMQWQLQSIVDGRGYLDYEFPLQQMNGVNVSVPNELVVVHPLGSVRDAENYLARLAQVDARMAEAVAASERQVEAGIVPPRFILDATIAQMERFMRPSPADNPLATVLRDKLAEAPGVEPVVRDDLLARAIEIIAAEIYPAWRSAIVALDAQRPEATDDAGLWRFADGERLYAQRLRYYTTTGLTAAEIHEIGLAEVARIEAEMDGLFRALGYEQGSIAERAARLAADRSYPNTEEGRRRIMTDIDGILATALERTASSFNLRPTTPVVAQPYPEFRWADAAATYSAPPPDGSRPGIFQMPLRPSRLTEFELRTLVYHETVPGHHFQVGLETENVDLPAFRRIRAFGVLSASVEGWALYAERFAAEDGWYADDPVGLLGQLGDALWRARRLVVDTGLHAMRWTRQQAIDYGIEASEVDRYVVWPGQACSYMIGQLKIVELRERARAALGERFSIREFHDVVLAAGSVPLAVLEQEVDAYIARSR